MAEKESVTDRVAIKDVIEVGSSMGKYSRIPSISSDGRAGGSPFVIVDSADERGGLRAGNRTTVKSKERGKKLPSCPKLPWCFE